MNFSDYYQAYHQYFFVWEEDTDVLSVPGGSTIAYREQVFEILQGMAENGLPPFGSFLLAMIATNKTMDDALHFVQHNIIKDLVNKRPLHSLDHEIIDEAFAFLRTLQSVPQEYKKGKRRQILLQTIFANSHNKLNVATSKGIVKSLKNNSTGRSRLMRLKELNNPVLKKDFRNIGLLGRTFPSAQSIIDAMGELPALDETDIPLLEDAGTGETTYKDFVEELMSNPNSFQAGALIKPIWAGLNIPIFNAHPSEQPLGGVSDLSNKGDVDKLLVSEFANDELVFMNRIANNEALYLHREMPPVKDKLHRTILIDISLKNWGTPKILAWASYIAIAKHPKALSESRAFVLGNDCIAVDCNTIDAVIDGLQQTDAGLHAGKGLASFLEDNKQDKQLEIFYITTAAALLYPEVQQQLASHHALFKYLITTDAEGEINFYRRKNNTQKHLQTIRLPLQKLWTKKAVFREKQVVVESQAVVETILLPTPQPIKKILPFGDDVYCVANRCLLRRTIAQNKKAGKGWELLVKNVTVSGYYEIGRQKNGELVFLAFNPQNKELRITNLATGQVASTIFTDWRGKGFKEFLFDNYDKFIYLFSNPDAVAFQPDFKNGTITIEKSHLTSNKFGVMYPNRQKQISEFPGIYSNIHIFRNITEVYINQSNYLVFGNYQLNISHNGQLHFSYNTADMVRVKKAERTGSSKSFTFKDGSTVTVDPCGFITLTSSNTGIPEIVFSSVIDNPLGMATAKEFAGNDFFYNDRLGRVGVYLNMVGPQKLSAIKIIKNYVLNMGLTEARDIAEGSPCLISNAIDIDDAKKMVTQLEEAGCSATIMPAANNKQSIIAPDKFYQQNIATFIGHIINYAAAD